MEPSARQAWPDRAIGRIAADNATMISTRQLHALGVSDSSIADAVRRGRLYRVHQGVYSIVPPRARPRWAAEHAALLACGPTAVLSHDTAARLHGLELPGRRAANPGDVHVTDLGHRNGRARAGIDAHRTSDLPRGEVVRVGGLRVTSVARTIVDLSATLDPRAIEPLLDQALRSTSRAKLRAAARRRPRRPGVPALLALLDPARPSAEARSRTERRLRRMLVAAGLPAPEGNVRVGELMPDLLWREQRVIVEYDSDAFHLGPAGHRATWRRHDVFQAQGFTVVHVTWPQLRERPAQVVARVAAALARAGWTG